VAKTLAEDVPQVLDYLEGELPAEGFLFDELGIADASLAAFFRNAGFARFSPDPGRWPRTAAFVARVLATAPFQALAPFEERSIRTPIPEVRAALAGMGAPLTPQTVGSATPRRGMMPVV
jgi:glutathione S-transferase